MSACRVTEKNTDAVIRSENLTVKARLAQHFRSASICVMFILAGCHGSSNNPGSAPQSPPPVTIGGTVSGLASGAQFTVEDNGGDALNVNANGAFTFNTPISFNSGYAVTVTTQPAKQTCTVTNGTGTHATANVLNVSINCGFVPSFAYVTNGADNTVSQYTEDASGSLIPLASPTVSTDLGPVQVTINPAGSFAYVTTSVATVDQFTIGGDGTLTALGTPVAIGGGGLGVTLAVDPSGHFAYVAEPTSGVVAQFTIGADGMLTAMSTPSITAGSQPAFVKIHPGGRFAYVVNQGDGSISQYTIDATTGGSLVAMSTPSVSTGEPIPTFATIDPTGKYLICLDLPDSLLVEFSIGTDGALTPMPTSAVTGPSPALASFDLSGRFLYIPNALNNTISQFSMAADGTLAALSPATVATGGEPSQVTPDPTGRLMYVTNTSANTVSQYSIGQDGTLTPLSTATVTTGSMPLSIATFSR
jgi:6-phosphogluconolactonase